MVQRESRSLRDLMFVHHPFLVGSEMRTCRVSDVSDAACSDQPY